MTATAQPQEYLPGPESAISAAVQVPSSKSLTNRALVAAAVAGGGRVLQPLDCEDTRLLAQALAAAGWPISWQEDVGIEIGSHQPEGERVAVHLGNSGTGARLLLGLLAATPGRYLLDGTPRLRERPMAPLLAGLESLGAEVEGNDGCLPVRIDGRRLPGGRVELRPGASSQFVSALLLAAPLMAQDLELELVGPLPSRPYLDLTEDVLRGFGATLSHDDDGRSWRVAAGGLTPCTYTVEGDWSAAAFFLAAAAVAGGSVEVRPLRRDSRQGDRAICEVLENAGMELVTTSDGRGVRATGPARSALTANLLDTPDMFPALAAMAACRPYRSRLEGLENLRHKESDRLSVMVDNLQRLGAQLQVDSGSFQVIEPVRVGGADAIRVTAAADHRIAMAMAVTALHAGRLELDDPGCVQKSFPDFWAVWDRMLR